jgi:predicted RND superfamily exporter protein
MKPITLISLIAILVLAAYTIYKIEFRPSPWEDKINHYKKVADSLGQVVKTIDLSVKKKDSIILKYMSSLDVTLHELNKETFKNKTIVTKQLGELDSSRVSYCRELAKLGLKPDDCQ